MYRIHSIFQYPASHSWWGRIYREKRRKMLGVRNFPCTTTRSPSHNTRIHASGIQIKVWPGLRFTSQSTHHSTKCQQCKVSRENTRDLFGSVEMDERSTECRVFGTVWWGLVG